MTRSNPCALIMAGGTGGHVFPALAIARALQERGWQIEWLGTEHGLEQDIIIKANIPLHTISIVGIRRTGLFKLLTSPFRILWAVVQSCKIIYQLNPTVVLGMGGFASGPGGVAAWLLRKPLIIHEQNAVAGLTNEYLSKIANKVFEAFPNTFAAQVQSELSGNPVRKELYDLPSPEVRFKARDTKPCDLKPRDTKARDTKPHDTTLNLLSDHPLLPLRLLVLGGSRGAKALNEITPRSINKIPISERPEVWHQAGSGNEADTKAQYAAFGITAKVEPFINNMASAYEWADIVLCRSGALTVAELAAVGVGSILVPFPYAVDDHQTHNAAYLVNGQAAILCSQAQLTDEHLAQILLNFSRNREKIKTLAQNARALSKRDSVDKIVNAFLSFVS